jgi:hypothetical protein
MSRTAPSSVFLHICRSVAQGDVQLTDAWRFEQMTTVDMETQKARIPARLWHWKQVVRVGAAKSAAGSLISWMLQPPSDRCTLEEVKLEPFFNENLPPALHMITSSACSEELTADQRSSFIDDIRAMVYVSRKPSLR